MKGVSSNAMRYAATTLLLADTGAATGFEVLMVKRHTKARFMANVYVFPGGCVDAEDSTLAATLSPSPLAPFRVAALRELAEETGVSLKPHVEDDCIAPRVFDPHAAARLTPYAHWITPKQEKYRYDTWFFAAEVSAAFRQSAKLCREEREVADACWTSPERALERHHTADDPSFRLPPPTYLIVKELCTFRRARDVLAAKAAMAASPQGLPAIEPVLELDPTVIGGPAVIRRMYMQDAWVPTSVVPRPAGIGPHTTSFPMYDGEGIMREATLIIGGEGVPPTSSG